MMRKRFIITAQLLFVIALGFVVAGLVFKLQHKPNANEMFYIAAADAVIGIIIWGACKFSANKK